MLTQTLPTWMPRLSFAPVNTAPRGDTLIVVFLRGAADVLNMVVPHGEENYYQLRPTLGVPRPDDSRKKKEERVVDLDGFFGLHPSLSPLMDAWQEKQLAIIHACGAPDESAPAERIGESAEPVSAPLDHAYCTIPVLGKGTKSMEEDYLPHVVQCENGGADLESLKAQAVAARSYAYYKIETSGSVVDGTRDQVYSCGSTPNALQLQAVRETAGQVLMYRDIVVCAFFVAGANPGDRGSCVAVAGDSDPTNTERYVTYNEGLSGDAVHQTTLGWVSPTNYRNRGCLSQWGSRCLDEGGTGYQDILRFYYGGQNWGASVPE